jgi:tRNA uridine 5-carbamoylmethylation protein Kti12
VVTRLVRRYPDPLFVTRWDAPAVAVADERTLDPNVEVTRTAVRMHLEAARERCLWRLIRLPREHPPPAERVDHQRRAERAPVRDHSAIAPTGDRCYLEAGVGLSEELLT